MKTVFIILSATLIISGCSTSSKDETMEFIPGTYVRTGHNEFGKEFDTLVITIQNPTAKEFKIQNRWHYIRQVEGEANAPEYKVKETSGIYNSETKLLEEAETLDHYSFDIKQKIVFDGTTQFKKIK
ncbi:hypothetical protein ACFSQD_04725 [Flavihumibacter stibioxidans]|uniref:Lipoprotein n=1 Tax=Flavihumibacter stibioxidans TaxID=1834163 RepID=A0ABR7M3L4_9BACT|nr:hypothetical protein [Flavihumibacter stibioxidans]MBC6489612.1 hypothetical protein [Flavihumibacter stibioxidans]